MSLSMVIPTYNRKDAMLRTLKELEPLMEGCEIIVVSDSTDGTDEAVKTAYPRVRMIQNPKRRGLMSCLNEGMIAAKNTTILPFADDLHLIGPPLDFVHELLLNVARNGSMIGVHVVDKVSPRFNHKRLAKFLWQIAGQPFGETGERSGYADFTASFAFDKERIPLLYDESFVGGFHAETDFQLRAKAMGNKLYYDANLAVTHDESGLDKDYRDQTARLAAHKYLMKKHFPRSWFIKHAFFRLYLLLVRFSHS